MSSLTKKERLAKKRMLEQIKREIRQIQFDIKHSKVTNLKMAIIRNTKLSLGFCRMIAPFVLTAGITFGAACAIGDIPFVRDDVKRSLETKKEMDSHGKIRCEEQYAEFENDKGTISYIGAWQPHTDGLYIREVRTYLIGNVSEETIMELLEKNDTDSLDDIFGKPLSTKNEIRNNLKEEELATGAYLEAVTYFKDTNKYITVKQPMDDNLGYGVIWAVVTTLLEILTLGIASEHYFFRFEDYADKIKDNYPSVNVKKLKKKLEIKQNNYNRMTR